MERVLTERTKALIVIGVFVAIVAVIVGAQMRGGGDVHTRLVQEAAANQPLPSMASTVDVAGRDPGSIRAVAAPSAFAGSTTSSSLVGQPDPMLVEIAKENAGHQRPAAPAPLPLHPDFPKPPAPAAGTPAAAKQDAALPAPTANAEHLQVDVANDDIYAVTYKLDGPWTDYVAKYRQQTVDAGWTILSDQDLPGCCHYIRARRSDLEMTVSLGGNLSGNSVNFVSVAVTNHRGS